MASSPYQLHVNNFKVTISVIFISWFSWPCCFTRVHSCRTFHQIMFRPFSVVRNAVETTALLALTDYLTNDILSIGRITFFNQTDSRWNWRFLATVLSKLYPQMKRKNSEIKLKKKVVAKAICPRDVLHCRKIFVGISGGLLRHCQEQKQ